MHIVLKIETEESEVKLLLSKKEFLNILPDFKWALNEENFYDLLAYNDDIFFKLKSLHGYELLTPNTEYSLEMFSQIDCFSLDDYKMFVGYPLNNSFAKILGTQIVPINNCPTFKNYWYYLWRQEMSVFQKLSADRNTTLGFIHPITKRVLFYEESYYSTFKTKFTKMIDNLKRQKDKDSRYIRTICVYDKKSQELKYRILNPEFEMNSLGFIYLNPLEGDEDLFFKSYELTEVLYEEIKHYYNIEFDLDKNRYFFETLDAQEFTMLYKELESHIKKVEKL